MKVAVCFCGFNRDSYLKINLKKILNDYIFNNRLTIIDAYYHTYSSKYEDTNNPIDVENIKTSFQDNGIDNFYLIHEEYNLTYFLRKIKESNHQIPYNSSYPLLNRFLSSIYSFSKVYTSIDGEYDFILHLRLDYMDQINWNKYDISQLKKGHIVCGHQTDPYKFVDPRFLFGHFEDMINLKNMFTLFFDFYDPIINNRDHIFISTYITTYLKFRTLPISNMIDNSIIRNKDILSGPAFFKGVQTEHYYHMIMNIYNNITYGS